jgi:putative peptidoglycan lipid II flippase
MSVLRSFFIVSSGTLGSRVLGFFRDVVMAGMLGTSMTADAFFVAFKVPNLLRRLFAEGAFNVVFVPIFSAIKEKHGNKKAKQFSDATFTMLFIILLLITIVAEIFMPGVIAIIAPGFVDNPEKLELTIALSRITFPYLAFITFVSFAGGISNTFGRFAGAAMAPAFLNISFLVCMLLLPYFGISPSVATAIAVPVGGVLQVLLMLYTLRKIKFSLGFAWPPIHEKTHTLIKRLGPAALGVGVLQLSTLIDMFLASTLATGSISYLFYADRLNQLPLALIGIALGTVLLPHLSKSLKNKDTVKAIQTFKQSIKYGFLLGLLCAIGLSFIAHEIIQILFMRGSFTAESVLQSGSALAAYAIGLPAFIVLKITSTAFYAMEDTKTPVKIASVSLLINVILNLILMQYFAHVGLALATSISAWCGLSLHAYLLRDKMQTGLNKPAVLQILKLLGVGVVMFTYLTLFTSYMILPTHLLLQIVWLVTVVISSALVALISCHVLKVISLYEMKAVFSRKSSNNKRT